MSSTIYILFLKKYKGDVTVHGILSLPKSKIDPNFVFNINYKIKRDNGVAKYVYFTKDGIKSESVNLDLSLEVGRKIKVKAESLPQEKTYRAIRVTIELAVKEAQVNMFTYVPCMIILLVILWIIGVASNSY